MSVAKGLVDIVELLIEPSFEANLMLQDKVFHATFCGIVIDDVITNPINFTYTHTTTYTLHTKTVAFPYPIHL